MSKPNKINGGFVKLLNNNYALYIIAFLSFVDIWNNFRKNDTQSIVIFIVAAYLTSIASNNMIIILLLGLVASNLYKSTTEGFRNEERANLDDYQPDLVSEDDDAAEAFENKGDNEDDDDDEDDDDEDDPRSAKVEKKK